ncbi:MAG: hypothetical protein H8E41_13180 [Desulfobulbaceae bacterium]|uniref:Uncharacterized protein n=1 Tax=Candidatus Desulfobia pelagia TaxID=2841692 RepID=A0A8J6NFB4_9BACT|nr:hypothetical protein [Candidatus Desulfobia pelagia]
MKKKSSHPEETKPHPAAQSHGLQTIQVKVREDLYRAFQRCNWIVIHETGRTQLDIMNEMVEDFLVKHGC